MKVSALALAALLVGSPHGASVPPPTGVADRGPPFGDATRTFADAAACAAELAATVARSTTPRFAAAAGPYLVGPSDVRAHRIRALDWGHEIEEFRCLAARLSSRRWTHSMNDVKPFTLEDIEKMSFPDEK